MPEQERQGVSPHMWLCWLRGLRGPEPQIIYGDKTGPYTNETYRLRGVAAYPVKEAHILLDLKKLAELYPCLANTDL